MGGDCFSLWCRLVCILGEPLLTRDTQVNNLVVIRNPDAIKCE